MGSARSSCCCCDRGRDREKDHRRRRRCRDKSGLENVRVPYNLATPQALANNREYLLRNTVNLYNTFVSGYAAPY
jgi:hypothetical protein